MAVRALRVSLSVVAWPHDLSTSVGAEGGAPSEPPARCRRYAPLVGFGGL